MSPEDIANEVQTIANTEQAFVMSFVASDRAVRVSPANVVPTQIDLHDLYEIERVIESHKETGTLPTKLHLVIQSPGGYVHISTKIATYLRSSFEEVYAFVPYEASSGGTILCLAADSITMGGMANLTPVDPQTLYKGQRVSVNSYQQAIEEIEERFGKMRPEEIPPPYQQLASGIDPVLLKEMNKSANDAAMVAYGLLKKSYKPTTDEEDSAIVQTALALALSPRPHAHMIDAEEAKTIGLHLAEETRSMDMLRTYKKWVSSMLTEEQTSHIIRTFKPVPQGNK